MKDWIEDEAIHFTDAEKENATIMYTCKNC